MFCLDYTSFQKLCLIIINKIGEKEFKPLGSQYANSGQMSDARKKVSSVLPGEIKIAIFLQILAGGSYLDVMAIYHVVNTTVYRCFQTVLKWVHNSFNFPLVNILQMQQWDK